MKRKTLCYAFCLLLICGFTTDITAQNIKVETIAPGISKIIFGGADSFNPKNFCDEKPDLKALTALPNAKFPFQLDAIRVHQNARGLVIEIPLRAKEHLYGFGLQMNSFEQNGLKIRPVVNDNPLNNLGFTHAPLPYYVSTAGYGVLVNTSRYITFYTGSINKKAQTAVDSSIAKATMLTTDELYKNRGSSADNYVTVDVPGASKIEVFVFAGPDMKTAVQRYNLFSGGGAFPAWWSLMPKYRVKADFNELQVLGMADYFRKKQIPIGILGLEPKWQTAAYSCSYVWNNELFPHPQQLVSTLKQQGIYLNLWEHAFVSPVSPLRKPLQSKSGSYTVWNGLVPDFADSAARNIFAAYHRSTFADQGISGFKLDECDNSNLAFGNATWSFPELSEFPSSISGEQMHQLFGLLYQKTIFSIYKDKNQRTLLDVRASNAFASAYPAALYSDTYEHSAYIRMISNTGFSGLIWTPEVRESATTDELLKRVQTAVLSAQTVFNSWYLKNPPWLQINIDKNNHDDFMPDAAQTEQTIKALLQQRTALIPYLYQAFAAYKLEGKPPFRALVMDYPQDEKTFGVADEYLIGEQLLAAPFYDKQNFRMVYLPAGKWYNMITNELMEGGKSYRIQFNAGKLPLFVKSGTILPLAEGLENTNQQTIHLNCFVYGEAKRPAVLFEDDGQTYNYEKGVFNTLTLTATKKQIKTNRKGNYQVKRYIVDNCTFIP